MSSPDRTAKKTAARKPAKKTAVAPPVARDPSGAQKVALLKAMYDGIAPGSKAAIKSAAKKQPAGKKQMAAKKQAPGKAAPGRTSAAAKGTPAGHKPSARTASKPQAAKQQVEVLRRIPAASQSVESEASRRARALAAEIEKALADGALDHLQPHAVQSLMGALCKFYAANYDMGERYPVVAGRVAVTGTDVMIVCGSLLKAADLQVFELGMWQSWAGR